MSDEFSITAEKGDTLFNFSILMNMKVAFKARYPLDVIFDQENMVLYNRIFKLLLEIKKAKFALTSEK